MNWKLIQSRVLMLAKQRSPYRSGQMAQSINLVKTDTGFYLEITAPHTVFTNEPWLSPRWKGRANPNEAWIEDLHRLVAELIARETNGKLKQK